MAEVRARVGVIGGSGFYQMPGLSDIEEISPETPYGRPSDDIVVGTLEGERVAFLPRHGRNHSILPSELPARANVYAMKELGVEFLISVSAVGSLREEIAPLDMVTPDQLIDRTRGRASTFFGDGVVAHAGFAEPFCPALRGILASATASSGAHVHKAGTYMVMEGPAFSTRAESLLYRSWGADVIGMTALPEAKLAREAELCYAILACSTDYDCWHPAEESVSADMILANLRQNVAVAQEAVRKAVATLPARRDCSCGNALHNAIVTPLATVPEQRLQQLKAIVGKYLPSQETVQS